MATIFQSVANNAVSTLATAINASETTLVVQSGAGALFPVSTPFHITIESEILICTSRSSDTLIVSRAAESTSAASHEYGSQVALNIISKHISDLNTAVNSVEAALASSDGLRGLIGDETGTGGAVFATGPVLDTPVLNTGVSGTAISTDTALGTSNTLLSSQGAVKAYVDAQVATADTLSEVLALGNTSGSTSLVIDSGQVLTTNTINETTATSGVTIDAVLLKDNTVTATTFTGALTGNADTVTTNADLTGHVTSTGNATILGTSAFTKAELSAAVSDGAVLYSGDAASIGLSVAMAIAL